MQGAPPALPAGSGLTQWPICAARGCEAHSPVESACGATCLLCGAIERLRLECLRLDQVSQAVRTIAGILPSPSDLARSEQFDEAFAPGDFRALFTDRLWGFEVTLVREP